MDGGPEGGGVEGNCSPMLANVGDKDLEVMGARGEGIWVELILTAEDEDTGDEFDGERVDSSSHDGERRSLRYRPA